MCVICKDPGKAESATGNMPIGGWITQLARGKTLLALELTFNGGHELLCRVESGMRDGTRVVLARMLEMRGVVRFVYVVMMVRVFVFAMLWLHQVCWADV